MVIICGLCEKHVEEVFSCRPDHLMTGFSTRQRQFAGSPLYQVHNSARREEFTVSECVLDELGGNACC